MEKLSRNRVYLIRKRGMGDVLWIEPVIRQLAAKNKKVIVYTKFPELFHNYPYPNVLFKKDISFIEKLAWKLTSALRIRGLFIDLELAYESNPRIHFLNAYQQIAGQPFTREYPRLYLDRGEENFRPVEGPYIALHLDAASGKNYRKVYGVDWARVVSRLQEAGLQVVQLGKQAPLCAGVIKLETTLREMISTAYNASYFIGVDSGPSHIAASLGIPSLIFFGAVDPATRHFKELFKGFFLQQPCEFAGCFHDVIIPPEPTCRLVGDTGVPKCSLHTTEYVLNNIDLLLKDFPYHDPKAHS